MILMIDNYDSFTWNLVHCLWQGGAEVAVYRNDALSVAEALALAPDGVVISPGPKDPQVAGICVDLIRACGEHKIPLLGVCLGHQAIAVAFGAKIVRAPVIMHGKVDEVLHHQQGLFANAPSPLRATRYHSLVVDPRSVPADLQITARTQDGTIMGLAHRSAPIEGVQFHPESIASEQGMTLIDNFLTRCQPGIV